MKEQTSKALDAKIHSFLARKFQEYPDLDVVDIEPKHSKRMMRERHHVMHTFIPARLNIQF